MAVSLFTQFCEYVDETIFPKENGGETVAFIVDQAFIDDFCKKYETSEKLLLREVRLNLFRTQYPSHLHIKEILAIQLYAATKREDSGGITEKNYRNHLSQVLDWDIQDLARLADNPAAEIGFNIEYWTGYISTTIMNILRLQGYTAYFKNGLVTGTDQSGRGYCIVHPLWSKKRVKEIIDGITGIVQPISIFDISKLK